MREGIYINWEKWEEEEKTTKDQIYISNTRIRTGKSIHKLAGKWANSHKTEGQCQPLFPAASGKHRWGLETFWDHLKFPSLITLTYLWIYILTQRSNAPDDYWGMMTWWSRLREQSTIPGRQDWPQKGRSKEQNGSHILAAPVTNTFDWRRVW